MEGHISVGVVDYMGAVYSQQQWANRWNQVVRHTDEGKTALQKYEAALTTSQLGRASRGRKSRPPITDVIDFPAKPFPTVIPHVARKRKGKWLKALLYGDSHFPFADPRALAVVLAIMEAEKPDVVVHVGDGMDCYGLSRFNKNPARIHSLQDEIDAYRVHLEQVAQTVPDAERVVLAGNHDDRLERLLWSLPRDVQQITRLRNVHEALQWPSLLDLDTIGWTWLSTREQTRTAILPKFIVKHGERVSIDSAMSARREMKTHTYSGASGHTHRKGTYFQGKGGVDRGNYVWLELGCTCDLYPEYAPNANWQQGCVVINFNLDTGGFHISDFYIHEGNAMGPGVEYVA